MAPGGQRGYEHTIATVWQLAFEQAAKDPLAGRLLGVCAHLAPDRIPRELLEAAARGSDGDVPVAVLDAVDDGSPPLRWTRVD